MSDRSTPDLFILKSDRSVQDLFSIEKPSWLRHVNDSTERYGSYHRVLFSFSILVSALLFDKPKISYRIDKYHHLLNKSTHPSPHPYPLVFPIRTPVMTSNRGRPTNLLTTVIRISSQLTLLHLCKTGTETVS